MKFLCILLVVGLALCEQQIDAKKHVDDFLDDLTNDSKSEDPHAHHNHAEHTASTGGHDHSGHMMMMFFHGGCNEVILFDFWRINSYFGLIVSSAFIFIMGAAYEGLKWFRVYLQVNQTKETVHEPEIIGVENNGNGCLKMKNMNVAEPLVETRQPQVHGPSTSPFPLSRLVQAFLYIVQLVLAYWLMLIVMTYNSWLTLAVILGAGFGHWAFAVLQLKTPHGQAADSFATDACH
ncbi:unnamed protein product [Caenorhabditis angaria]|uniref:Copper transport protein n=1 Tax=Caenorhabditis angaria TaxID=860376 RepID=A0A9P1J174_9PELO|nr:unnamed protein product [Caenorhabditis angaria]